MKVIFTYLFVWSILLCTPITVAQKDAPEPQEQLAQSVEQNLQSAKATTFELEHYLNALKNNDSNGSMQHSQAINKLLSGQVERQKKQAKLVQAIHPIPESIQDKVNKYQSELEQHKQLLRAISNFENGTRAESPKAYEKLFGNDSDSEPDSPKAGDKLNIYEQYP